MLSNYAILKGPREKFNDLESFLGCYEEALKRNAFQKLLVLNIHPTIEYKVGAMLEERTKNLAIVLLSGNFVEQPEIFARHFQLISQGEKLATKKEPNVEAIESYIKGVDRYLVLAELPQLIKRNQKSVEKYSCISKNFKIFGKLFK